MLPAPRAEDPAPGADDPPPLAGRIVGIER
jgi:hypothetical protein